MVRQTVLQARAIARSIESTAGYYVIFGLNSDLENIVTDLRKNPSIEYADFVGTSGSRLASTSPKIPQSVLSHPLVAADGTEVGGGDYLFIVPFREAKAEGGVAPAKGYFRLLTNSTEADRAASELRWWNVVISVGSIALALVLAYFLSQWIVRPVMALAGTAQLISQGDLTQRVTASTTDEIGSRAEVFNSMSTNLERTLRSVMQSQAKLKSVVETVDSRSRTVIDRVDEQRSIIDETYHSIDKLNGGVLKITDNVEARSAAS